MLPLFYPRVEYVKHIPNPPTLTLEELCLRAGVPCRASGAWTERPIVMTKGPEWIKAEGNGSRFKVWVQHPDLSPVDSARWVLGALAYSTLFDGVARESIRGAPWRTIKRPRGRPKTGQALSPKARAQRFRQKNVAEWPKEALC